MKKIAIRIVLGVLIIALGYFVYNLIHTDVKSSGLTSVISKEIKDDKQFIYIRRNDMENGSEITVEIECDEETYDNIIVDKKVLYNVNYSYSASEPKKGSLIEKIDTTDYIDNREKQGN